MSHGSSADDGLLQASSGLPGDSMLYRQIAKHCFQCLAKFTHIYKNPRSDLQPSYECINRIVIRAKQLLAFIHQSMSSM
jgi:hypothetical protein